MYALKSSSFRGPLATSCHCAKARSRYLRRTFNGETFWVESAAALDNFPAVALDLRNIVSDTAAEVLVPTSYFEDGEAPDCEPPFDYQIFDYGYVLTAHKAQGSEWPAVAVVNESFVFGEMARRWLYTAITRASERLTIVKRSVR